MFAGLKRAWKEAEGGWHLTFAKKLEQDFTGQKEAAQIFMDSTFEQVKPVVLADLANLALSGAGPGEYKAYGKFLQSNATQSYENGDPAMGMVMRIFGINIEAEHLQGPAAREAKDITDRIISTMEARIQADEDETAAQ